MAVFRNLYNLTFCFIGCRLVAYTIDFFTNLILNEASFSYSVTFTIWLSVILLAARSCTHNQLLH